jgi:hypothetical protein
MVLSLYFLDNVNFSNEAFSTILFLRLCLPISLSNKIYSLIIDMAPNHRRGPWVPEEDSTLIQLVHEQGRERTLTLHQTVTPTVAENGRLIHTTPQATIIITIPTLCPR